MDIIDILAESHRLAPQAREFGQRQYGIFLGIFTNIDDPLELGRAKFTTADKGGITETDHSLKVLPCPGWNPPDFSPGQTGILANLSGDPHNRVYLGGLLNATNPLPAKENPDDDLRIIPGNAYLGVGKDLIIEANSITFKIGDYVLTIDGTGIKGSAIALTVGNYTLSIDSTGIKANGINVIGLGSADTAGNVNVTLGY